MTYASEMVALLSDIESVFGENVTLRKNMTSGFDTSAGLPSMTTSTQTVKANRMPIRASYERIGEGRAGDIEVVFHVVISSVTLGAPQRGWGVIDADGNIYRVVRVEIDSHRLSYILNCKAGV